ncbi:MAG: glycosyltransferase family 1 protein, partial [Deltaproteobacteria bacterium]|nr:glycosyltransferase family 1 protein [Deltaproteobacteria bacterium]
DYVAARSRRPAIRADGRLHAAARHLPYQVKGALKALLGWLPIRHEAIEQEEVSFTEIEACFFAKRPRCPVYSKCISSRHFEAAATGTCQLLKRGRYNDILVADHDYIAIDGDLGNASESIRRFLDRDERRRVVESAHALVHQEHTYAHRLARLYDAISGAGRFGSTGV